MSDPIERAILNHTSADVGEISRQVSEEFGQYIPKSHVMKVLGRNKRSYSVSSAKDKASESLTDKVSLMESVAEDLVAQFQDKTLSVTERMKVAQELRQWTKLSLDVAGIHDEDTDQLWVIDSTWDTRPSEEPN